MLETTVTPRLPIEICTTRLRLRKPRPSDAAEMFRAYTQDSDVCRYMIWVPHASESITSNFVSSCCEAWEAGNRLPYVITELSGNVAIGMIEARVLGTTLDVGYVLAKSHWGRGFMPEVIEALSSIALKDFFRVQASCDVDNTASQRALEKAGFVREGRLERHTIHPNVSPEPRPCYLYAKCR